MQRVKTRIGVPVLRCTYTERILHERIQRLFLLLALVGTLLIVLGFESLDLKLQLSQANQVLSDMSGRCP